MRWARTGPVFCGHKLDHMNSACDGVPVRLSACCSSLHILCLLAESNSKSVCFNAPVLYDMLYE